MTGRVIIGIGSLVATALACAPRETAERETPRADSVVAQGPRPTPEVIAQAVDSVAARIVDQGLTPALGVAIVMDGKTILAKSYGMTDATNRVPADDRTLWYIASTSKSLTGFGISLLAHQRVVDLKAPITTLLPSAQWPNGYDATRFTLDNFLSHTHQLDDEIVTWNAAFTGAIPETQWPSLLRYAEPQDERQLSYSNLGYYVAAMVIDAKRPEGWRRYLDSAVYTPAGMNDTYACISCLDRRRIALPHELRADGSHTTLPFYKTDETMTSAGGHLSTLSDLARWITVQMDSGVIAGARVFPAEAVALSHRVIAQQTDAERSSFAYFKRDGWGAGWDIGSYEAEPMVSRFGAYSSTRSHLSFLPRRRIGVVTQVNGDLAFSATDIIAAYVYDLERGRSNARALVEERLATLTARRPAAIADAKRRDSVVASRTEQKPRRSLSDYVGSYRHPSYGTITFEMRGKELYYRWGALSGMATGRDATAMNNVLSDAYFRVAGRDALRIVLFPTGGTTVEFKFPRSGPASSVEVREQLFVRQ